MQVDTLSLGLAPQEVCALLLSVPLPEGIRITDIALKDTGVEATVKASFLLNIPVKFKAEIQSYAGSRVFVKIAPPVKPNWLVIRPLMLSVPGVTYAGHSVVELDLIALSGGYLSSVVINRVVLNKSGFRIEASSAKSNMSWEDLLQNMPW